MATTRAFNPSAAPKPPHAGSQDGPESASRIARAAAVVQIEFPMYGRERLIASSAVIVVLLAACTKPSVPTVSDVDAGATLPKPIPAVPALPTAVDDGCIPYWEEVDLKCDEAAIRARFHVPSGVLKTCDPVHERVTRTVVAVILGRQSAEPSDPATWEYLRGAAWNDDPQGLLFSAGDGPGAFADNVDWCTSFAASQAKALQGAVPAANDPLNARSQFGDLQFLHGLASRPGEKAIETYKRLAVWLEAMYRVAAGEISGDTPVEKVPVDRFPSLFPRQAKLTVAQLLGIHSAGDVRARAWGSFLHVLQDVVGEGHTATRPTGGGPPAILHYFTYSGGTNPGHGGDPGWRSAWAPDASFDAVPRMDHVVLREIDLSRLLARKMPWSMIKTFVDRFFFEFDSFDAPAVRWAPGAESETKHEDTSHRAYP
jgi:hypothetical protein